MIAPHHIRKIVLIADADESRANVYAPLLRRQFYDVRTARDGLDCLAQIRECPPDVLVLNRELTWGGSDGLLALLRESPQAESIPVVLTTGELPCSAFPRLTVPPIVRCLRKPYAFQALLEAVRAAIKSTSEVPEMVREWKSRTDLLR